MKKETAIKVYKLVLKEINGWDDNRIDELSFGIIQVDPFYEKLIKIKE